jgi:hypothetical protein
LAWGCGLDSTGSGQGPVASCCKCGDEPSGSCATELVSVCVQTGCGVHPASCTMGTGGLFPVAKTRPGRDADHSPASSA